MEALEGLVALERMAEKRVPEGWQVVVLSRVLVRQQ
jgi:hypothetical protein